MKTNLFILLLSLPVMTYAVDYKKLGEAVDEKQAIESVDVDKAKEALLK